MSFYCRLMNLHTAAKLLQSCPTLCDPTDGSPPGSAIPGILQARTLEWVAISFSNAWKWKVKVKSLSCVWLLATPWTAAYQALPSMGFSRQEYWSGVPLSSPITSFLLLLWVSLFIFHFCNFNPSVSWWEVLWVHLLLESLVLLRLGCIFPSPGYRWFQPLFLQIGFLSLWLFNLFLSAI